MLRHHSLFNNGSQLEKLHFSCNGDNWSTRLDVEDDSLQSQVYLGTADPHLYVETLRCQMSRNKHNYYA